MRPLSDLQRYSRDGRSVFGVLNVILRTNLPTIPCTGTLGVRIVPTLRVDSYRVITGWLFDSVPPGDPADSGWLPWSRRVPGATTWWLHFEVQRLGDPAPTRAFGPHASDNRETLRIVRRHRLGDGAVRSLPRDRQPAAWCHQGSRPSVANSRRILAFAVLDFLECSQVCSGPSVGCCPNATDEVSVTYSHCVENIPALGLPSFKSANRRSTVRRQSPVARSNNRTARPLAKLSGHQRKRIRRLKTSGGRSP